MMDIVSVQGVPFITCLVTLAILGYIGIHVLKREIIFIDIALAQIAAVGAIAAHVFLRVHEQSMYKDALALGSTFVAAAFFAVVRRRVNQIPLEAVIGVCYAVSAASALFLVGIAPGGHVHVQEMLAGSILWATWHDVLWSAGVFTAVGVCFYVFRKPFREISEDYDGAAAKGFNTLGWDFLFYALLGVVITVAVRVAGVVVVFTFLIIPATLSAAFASGWMARLVVAWVAGAVATGLGLLFAERYDFSVGPAIALFLGLLLIVVGLLRLARVARTQTAAATLAIAGVLAVWFAVGSGARDFDTASDYGGTPSAGAITKSHAHLEGSAYERARDTEFGNDEIIPGSLDTLNVEQLERIYAGAADAEERSMVVSRMLHVDLRSGARMAIEFLEEDPPLLFRLTVVEKLEEATGKGLSYDIDLPFAAPPNQKAVSDLRERLALE